MVNLSVIIITKNEELDLPSCLQSVAFADECIIVDNGSTDQTPAIAKSYDASFYTEEWHGFGPQKNLALSKAKNEWVLSIDADEIVPNQLAQEIQSILENPSCNGYEIPRTSTFCGHTVRFGDWGRDKVLRLFRKEAGRFTDASVHERVIVKGEVGTLQHAMLHNSVTNIDDAMEKMRRYATISSQELRATGKHGSMTKALLHGGWTFIRGYLLLFGWLDGRAGFTLARLCAMGVYLKYKGARDTKE